MAEITVEIRCPYCGSNLVTKAGKSPNGAQKCTCHNSECPHTTFQLSYTYTGSRPGIEFEVLNMSINGSGIRDTARVLGVSCDFVISVLKKKNNGTSKST